MLCVAESVNVTVCVGSTCCGDGCVANTGALTVNTVNNFM